MNLLLRSTILTILFTFSLNALAEIILEKKDLSHASDSAINGETYVLATLTESGSAKIKDSAVGSNIKFHIGGVDQNLKLRVPLSSAKIQFGPFDKVTANKIVVEINGK